MQAAGEPSNAANAHIVNVNRMILYFVLHIQLYLTYFSSGNSSSNSNLFSYIIMLYVLLNVLLLILLLQALVPHQSCGYGPTFSCRGYCFQYKDLRPFNLSGSTKQTFGSYHSILAN